MNIQHKSLEEASKSVKPIYAQGFFFVGLNYVSYYLVFDYIDPLEYYNTIRRDEKLFEEEVSKLWINMQQFLDEEEVKINNTHVSPKVVMIDIGFRNSKKRPYIIFTIRFKAPLRKGVNVYENRYESETIEYDYVAYWVFPPNTKILRVDMGSGGETWDVVGNNIIAIYGFKGMRSGGYEYIEFEITETNI